MTTSTRSSKRLSKRAQATVDKQSEQESPTKKVRQNSQCTKSSPTKSKSKKIIQKQKAEECNEATKLQESQQVDRVSVSETIQPVIPVDDFYPSKSNVQVVGDFDATLNRTDITFGNNKNKYYRIQMVKGISANGKYRVFTRWGRVGEVYKSNSMNLGPFAKFEKAEKAFEKKFRDKTANSWKDRANFQHVRGKYDLLEVDYNKESEDILNDIEVPRTVTSSPNQSNIKYLPSKLDPKTKELIDILFERDMFEHAMTEYDFDIRRMPLGQLSSAQVQRGVDVLSEIEGILRHGGSRSQLPILSSRFYSVLPHDFGRRRPPIISTMEVLQKAFDKCNLLLDIEKANQLIDNVEQKPQTEVEAQAVPDPSDALYDSLNANLTLVDKNCNEFERVLNAFESTAQHTHTKLLNVWRVDRHGEAERFAPFVAVSNKKCLWHGTNIAVVAAILSSGLRIMPHSGGRVGRGIYLASECGKSQGYTRPSYSRNIGCMFLAEAALGKEFDLLYDNSSLVKAPNGFDSVVARGHQTPASCERISFDGHDALLPTGKPKRMSQYAASSFSQDEYLVYREEQVRLRYVVSVQYGERG